MSSTGMIGRLPLSAWQGVRDDLETRIAGKHGEEWLSSLKRFMNKENPWDSPEFPIWKHVVVGGNTVDELIDALNPTTRRFRCHVIMSQFPYEHGFVVETEERTIPLFDVSLHGLGFTDVPKTLDEIWEKGSKCGLYLCPPETIIQLCIQHPDETYDVTRVVAMRSIGAHSPAVWKGEKGCFDMYYCRRDRLELDTRFIWTRAQ